MDIITSVQAELLRAAATLVAKKDFHHLLYIGDLPLPEDLVKGKSHARRKLVQAVTSDAQRQVLEAMGIPTLSLPSYDLARPERFKIALVGGIAKQIFRDGETVVGIIGKGPLSYPDTLYVVAIGEDDDSVDTGFGVIGTDRIPSAILESVIDLAVDIARDGWEGRPLGTLIVLGDTPAVMEKSRQLTLNPFQGYSESEKNILNPDVRDAIKNFAVLDGAFVIREDGVVLAAGRYLKFDEAAEFEIPLGLGARHMAAAGISKVTDAIAIVVSETSGIARVFQNGVCTLELNPEHRNRRSTDELMMGVAAAVEQVTADAADSAAESSDDDGDGSKSAGNKDGARDGKPKDAGVKPKDASAKPRESGGKGKKGKDAKSAS
ncbi:MAG: diadenylate cyclase [Myxococcales bacterium]|nr:diadenylate cyclase [Myxococcales bacterium]